MEGGPPGSHAPPHGMPSNMMAGMPGLAGLPMFPPGMMPPPGMMMPPPGTAPGQQEPAKAELDDHQERQQKEQEQGDADGVGDGEDAQEDREEEANQGGEPNPTVYVHNLPEKVKGDKLKRGLKQVFSQYGKIHKISTRRSLGLRGQAFIVYHTTDSAAAAVEKTKGFNFYGKPLRVAFARQLSDWVAKRQGHDVEKRSAHPKKGMVAVKVEGQKKAKAPAAAPMPVVHTHPAPFLHPPGYGHHFTAALHAVPNGGGMVLPHSILFAQDLPPEAPEEMLTALFSQYPGFKEVRMVAGKGVAFVEYMTEPQATDALKGLSDFKLTPDHPLKLSYARK